MWAGMDGSGRGAAIIEAAGGTVHWLDATGARLRAAHFPHGERGTVLLLHGRTEFIEKYLEPVAEWQARGYAVWTLDWRGQGLSTRPLPDPHAQHIRHFDEYLGDLDQLLDRHIRPGLHGRPLLLMGHSMGGHLGARLLARRGGLFRCAILLAPMMGVLRNGRPPGPLAGILVRAMCLLGQARRYGPGAGPVPPHDPPFHGNRLTQCPTRYADHMRLLRETPALQLGGYTWGWLRAAMASMAALRRPGTLARIDVPVLVAIAGAESIVDNRAIRRFALRLRRGKIVVIAGARHELLREHDQHRHALWAAIDAFLDEKA